MAELIALQDDYWTWLNALPQNLEASATAEALRAICDLDLSDLESVQPPRGFGRRHLARRAIETLDRTSVDVDAFDASWLRAIICEGVIFTPSCRKSTRRVPAWAGKTSGVEVRYDNFCVEALTAARRCRRSSPPLSANEACLARVDRRNARLRQRDALIKYGHRNGQRHRIER